MYVTLMRHIRIVFISFNQGLIRSTVLIRSTYRTEHLSKPTTAVKNQFTGDLFVPA